MRMHQRESNQCRPSANAHDSQVVKRLHEKLESLVAKGKALASHGSFEQTQQNTVDVAEAEAAIKKARKDGKADALAVKELAKTSMSAASWTQARLITCAVSLERSSRVLP